MADTDMSLAISHPQLRTLNLASTWGHRVFFTVASLSGLAAIYFLVLPAGPLYIAAHPEVWNNIVTFFVSLVIIGLLDNRARAVCSTTVLVNRDGLTLPPLIARLNKVGAWQSWGNVIAASISGSSEADRCLLLQLQSGSAINLPMAGLEPQTLEQFLLSMELWGTHCEWSQSLKELQSELHNQNKGLQQLSYTDMWNEELGRRFASTTFVPLEPGAKLQNGRLEVIRQLAFGGLSALYLVQDGHKDMRVLKEAVVPAGMEVHNKDAAEKALEREANILAQLSHPGIINVVDHFVEAEHHYLVLQHVAGQDLRQMVRQNGAQSEEKVLDWALQIASALEYLHTYNPPIIHRDLTPENIVLRNDGTIIIIDFGASNQFLGTMTGTIIGKQAYMAPEQLQGHATNQSDIYSFGGTIQFLLTAKDPFPLSESTPKDFVTVSEQLDDIVRRCTRLDSADRFASITEVKVELTKLYSQSGIAKIYTGAENG